MCRMIAYKNFDRPSVIRAFLNMAIDNGKKHEYHHSNLYGTFMHDDGWGMVYKDSNYELYKSTNPAFSELMTIDKRDSIILHARKASVGGTKIENTHPFEADYQGKKWFFCHNGTVNDGFEYSETGDVGRANVNVERMQAKGDTDTEKYFYYLLDSLSSSGPTISKIQKSLQRITDFTSLNAFLFDGAHLYVINKYIENPKYYNLSIMHKGDGFIVSPEQFEIEGKTTWHPMENGQIAEINVDTHSVVFS